MPKQNLTLLTIVLVPLFSGSTYAESINWPQWRGPDRTNISTETGLLKSWPEGGPKRLWLFENCGVGYSGPAIVDDRLFTMGARDDAEQVMCINAQTGTEIWSAGVGEVLDNDWGDGPRSTPTVDNGQVYALGGQGNLVCLNVSDGKEAWRASLTELGGSVPNWGYTESVLVDGPAVVCTPGGKKGAMVALNKQTGEVIWRSQDFTDEAQYSSILPVDHNGARQYIQLSQKNVVGIDSQTGKTIWKTDWPGRVAVIPSPIFHNGHVYATAGYGAGCNLFKLGPENEVNSVYDSEAKQVMKNHHGGVLLFEDHVYGFSDGGGWVCQELMTGKVKWRDRNGLSKGGIGYADRMLYLVSEQDGTVVLIDASPNGWNETGRFTLDPQTKLRKPSGRIWVHPVVVNGHLLLRDQDLLFCYDVKGS